MTDTLSSPIMVVEDSDEDFDTLLEALDKCGIKRTICRAVSGDECLALLRRTITDLVAKPNFILLDLNIPGTDGRETLREIKTEPLLKWIPAVVFTTSANPNDLKSCYELGANAYHIKPMQHIDHINQLEEIFRYWLKRVDLLNNIYVPQTGGYLL